MQFYILVIIISLFGFFVNPFDQTGNLVLKIFLFFGLAYIIYSKYSGSGLFAEEDKTPNEEKKPSLQNPQIKLADLSTEERGSLNQLITDKSISLNSFLLGQFDILFNFFLPSNGHLFIENQKDDIRLFYKRIKQNTVWNESAETPNILKLLQNHTGEILVENALNSDSNILPYYEPSSYSPGSVLSFSTSITEDQKIYWVFDAPATGYFNEEDFNVLSQVGFTSQYTIINAFKQKHLTEELSKQKKINELISKLNSCPKQIDLTSVFIEYLTGLFEAHKLTIAMIDENNTQMATIIKTVGQVDSLKAGTRFRLDEGLCGKVLSNKQTYLIEDIEKDGYFIPRFSKNEKTNYGLRSFLAIPFLIESEAKGLIVLEHKNPGRYTNNEKSELKEYAEYYSKALSRFLTTQQIEHEGEEN